MEAVAVGKTHLSRRELIKQDEFLLGATESWDFLREHTGNILFGVGAVVVVVAVALGVTWYIHNRQVMSNEEISNAVQTYNSPTIAEGLRTPLGPNQRIFATSQEKYTKAEEEFARLSRKFSGKPIGETAAYYDAMCKYNLGNTASAIQQLETLTQRTKNAEVNALAKLSLAQMYAIQKNTTQVTMLLQQLIDHPTVTVPKVTAMMALAEYYRQINNKDAAIQIYKRVQSEFPTFQIQTDVRQRLMELGQSS
jgi:predicted negative regulator of RcsB-dependent stress response